MDNGNKLLVCGTNLELDSTKPYQFAAKTRIGAKSESINQYNTVWPVGIGVLIFRTKTRMALFQYWSPSVGNDFGEQYSHTFAWYKERILSIFRLYVATSL